MRRRQGRSRGRGLLPTEEREPGLRTLATTGLQQPKKGNRLHVERSDGSMDHAFRGRFLGSLWISGE
jgi:hypothetical protein